MVAHSTHRSPAIRRAALLGCLASASVACGDAGGAAGDDAAGSAATVRDSAGVEIVENHIREDAPPAFVVADSPSLSIGSVDGAEATQLYRVTDAVRLPDGRVAVLNSGSHELRIYGTDGSLELSFGRQGDGPEEFAGFPFQLKLLPPDTFVVWDVQTWETSWFLADGSFIRKEPGRTAFERLVPEGRTGEGGYAVPGQGLILQTYLFGVEHPTGEAFVPSMELMFVGHEGEVRTLGEVGTDEQVVVETSPGRLRAAVVPFGSGSITAFGGRPPRLWAGRNDRYELRQFTAGGRLERIVRANATPRAVTEADVEQFVAKMREGMTNAGFPPDAIEAQVTVALSVPAAETMPVFGPAYVSLDGGVWVSRVTAPGGSDADRPVLYDIFAPDGRWRGVAEVARAVRPLEIGGDYLLGLRQDDLGVEYVELYEIREADPQG